MSLQNEIVLHNAAFARNNYGPDDDAPLYLHLKDEATGGMSTSPIEIQLYDDIESDTREKNFRLTDIERSFDGVGDDFYSSGKVLYLRESAVSQAIINRIISIEHVGAKYKIHRKVEPKELRADWRILLMPL